MTNSLCRLKSCQFIDETLNQAEQERLEDVARYLNANYRYQSGEVFHQQSVGLAQ